MKCAACKYDSEKATEGTDTGEFFYTLHIHGHVDRLFDSYGNVGPLYICPKCGTIKCNEWWCNQSEGEA